MANKKTSIKAKCLETGTSTEGSIVKFAADIDKGGKTAKTVIIFQFTDVKAVSRYEAGKYYSIEINDLTKLSVEGNEEVEEQDDDIKDVLNK